MGKLKKTTFNKEALFMEFDAGNRRSFEQLYEIYHKGVYYNLRRLTADDELAKELMQDTFIKIWEKRAAIIAEKSFGAYLFRVAQNLAMDYYRKLKRDKQLLVNFQLLVTELGDQTLESNIAIAEENILNQAIDTLSPQRKKIFMLCKLEGKSYQEVSGLLGISLSTISDHIVKATKSLKHQLKRPDLVKCALLVLAISYDILLN